MIQCVDSRQEPRNYCSRVCCLTSLKHALTLKKANPQLAVYILYRDMMTLGFTESYFTAARRAGILFVQYDLDHKPRVTIPPESNGPLYITVRDPILARPLEIEADLLVLATGIVPQLPENVAGRICCSNRSRRFLLWKRNPSGVLSTRSRRVSLAVGLHYRPDRFRTPSPPPAPPLKDHCEFSLTNSCRPEKSSPRFDTASAAFVNSVSIRALTMQDAWIRTEKKSWSTRPCVRAAATVPRHVPTAHQLSVASPIIRLLDMIDAALESTWMHPSLAGPDDPKS